MNNAAPTFRPTSEMIHAAKVVIMAKAWVETIRPIVEAYQTAIMIKIGAVNEETGEAITDMDKSYLMSDEQCNTLWSKLEEAQEASGLKVMKKGNCPLLEAKQLTRDAERTLCNTMAPLTGTTYETIITSRDSTKNLNEYIDLTLQLLTRYIKG